MTDARKVAFRAEAPLAANTLVPRRLPDGRREGGGVDCDESDAHRRAPGQLHGEPPDRDGFCLEVSGGNLTSLAAYLFRVKHGQAAARIADALGPVSNVRWHRSAGVARANLEFFRFYLNQGIPKSAII
jgi:hypothetical protein